MSLIGRHRGLFRRYIPVTCPCGRLLRAKHEMAGEEIRCWSCREMVAVPIPREPGWVARALQSAMKEALQARTLGAILVGSIVLTATLAMPGFGVVGVGGMLGVGALIYGYLIREGSRTDRSVWPKESRFLWVYQVLLCVAVGLLVISPWLINSGGPGNPPRFTKLGLILALAASVMVPLVMLGSFARSIKGHSGILLVLRTLRRHPIATFVALSLVPISFICLELIVIGITRYEEIYQFFLLDLFPRPEGIQIEFGIPHMNREHYLAEPMSYYESLHKLRLRQGYTFIMGLTGSLAKLTDNGFNPLSIMTTERHYRWIRFFYVAIAGLGMLATLAIQARWLGMLSTLHTRRTVS